MKSLRMMFVALALMALGATAVSANADARVDRREWRQHQRIHRGWQSGQLTRGERVRLRAGQRHVHRMEWRSMRDGRIGPYERRRLERAQDRQSREIYRFRHNARSRVL